MAGTIRINVKPVDADAIAKTMNGLLCTDFRHVLHLGSGFEMSLDITPQMLAAGEEVILEEIGGADLGGLFSARELAEKVYRVMNRPDLPAASDE